MTADSRPKPEHRFHLAGLAFVALLHWDGGPVPPAKLVSSWPPIALNMPSTPFPGQSRPDANGHCPGKVQVAINGGCWVKLAAAPTDCDADGYVYKGGCYLPVFPPQRPDISNPSALRSR